MTEEWGGQRLVKAQGTMAWGRGEPRPPAEQVVGGRMIWEPSVHE